MTTPTIATGTTISVMPASEVPRVAVAVRSTAAPAERCGVHEGRLTARGLFAQARLTCHAATAATDAQSTITAHRPTITDPTAAMNHRMPSRTFGPAVDGRTRSRWSPSVAAGDFFGTAFFFDGPPPFGEPPFGEPPFEERPFEARPFDFLLPDAERPVSDTLARDVVPRPGPLFRDFVDAAVGL